MSSKESALDRLDIDLRILGGVVVMAAVSGAAGALAVWHWKKRGRKTRKGRPRPTAQEIIKAYKLIPHPEGGYFREQHRSGSTPMSTKGATDMKGHLTPTMREHHGGMRNVMTSIYWMATAEFPLLYFGRNESEHVHYYHAGTHFMYILVHIDGRVEYVKMGDDVANGEVMQMAVPSGTFKAGFLMSESDDDFFLCGEAVAPGFDFVDFDFVHEDALRERLKGHPTTEELLKYIKPDRRRNFVDYYDKDTARQHS